MKARFFLLTLLLLPVACNRPVVETRPTIPLVREIIADRSDSRAHMLRERVSVPLSDITIIGSEFACDRLAEGFSFRDKQDKGIASFAWLSVVRLFHGTGRTTLFRPSARFCAAVFVLPPRRRGGGAGGCAYCPVRVSGILAI